MTLYVLQLINSWTILVLGLVVDRTSIGCLFLFFGFLFRQHSVFQKKSDSAMVNDILALVLTLSLVVILQGVSFDQDEWLYDSILLLLFGSAFLVLLYRDVRNITQHIHRNEKFTRYWKELFFPLKWHLKGQRRRKLPTIQIHDNVTMNHTTLERLVKNLLYHIPSTYLHRLHYIKILNSGDLPFFRRIFKVPSAKPLRAVECAGIYHSTVFYQAPYIELFVNNITKDYRSVVIKIPILREICFAYTLYHEVGHHIYCCHQPENRDGEVVADEWAEYLTLQFVTIHFWFLLPIFWTPLNIALLLYSLLSLFRVKNPQAQDAGTEKKDARRRK